VSSVLPPRWHTQSQQPVTLQESEPEPDVAVVRGEIRDYARQHPTAADVAVLIEAADSSLREDRTVKGPIYAAAGVPVYWIINLIDETIEVYTEPAAAEEARPAEYRSRRTFTREQAVPLVIDGRTVAEIPAAELLP
ncbi:MAG: Uma2 family endonuclease, partial [Planctomycetaceae bacterium]